MRFFGSASPNESFIFFFATPDPPTPDTPTSENYSQTPNHTADTPPAPRPHGESFSATPQTSQASNKLVNYIKAKKLKF